MACWTRWRRYRRCWRRSTHASTSCFACWRCAASRVSAEHERPKGAQLRLTELTADLQALRENLADELLAINRFEEQAFSLSDEDAKEAVQRIVDDKKDHVARLLKLLQKLDGKQREKIEHAGARLGETAAAVYLAPAVAAVAQLARASACHAEGRGFESLQPLAVCRPTVRDQGTRRPGTREGPPGECTDRANPDGP